MSNISHCRYGPLVNLWSMRFEAKHKEFKNVAKRGAFKNILKTLCYHHQRLKAYYLHYDNKFATVTVSTGSGLTITL